MAKKKDESVEVFSEKVETPSLIETDFGREDLNKMRDAVNYLISEA